MYVCIPDFIWHVNRLTCHFSLVDNLSVHHGLYWAGRNYSWHKLDSESIGLSTQNGANQCLELWSSSVWKWSYSGEGRAWSRYFICYGVTRSRGLPALHKTSFEPLAPLGFPFSPFCATPHVSYTTLDVTVSAMPGLLPPPPSNISPWHSKQAIHVQHCGFSVKCPLKGWLSSVVQRWAWDEMRSPISSVGWPRDGVIVSCCYWVVTKSRRWTLSVGSRSLGCAAEGDSCPWSPQFCLLCFQAVIRRAAVPCHVLPRWRCQRFCLSPRLKAKETANPELEPLKAWSKTKPCHLGLPDSLSSWRQSN